MINLPFMFALVQSSAVFSFLTRSTFKHELYMNNDVDDDEMGDSATMPESLPHSAALRKSSIPTLVTTRKKT